jgi:hypothetical protein
LFKRFPNDAENPPEKLAPKKKFDGKWTTGPKEFAALVLFVAWCLFIIVAVRGGFG